MRYTAYIGSLLAVPAVVFAGIDDWVSVVKVTDNFKQTSYEVMSNKDYTELTKALWHRNRMLTRAVRLAREEWNKGEDTKKKVFPVNITGKAEAKRLKTFPTAEKAQEHVAALQEEDAKKAEAGKPKTYLGQKIEALQDEIDRARKLPMTGARKRFIEDRLKEIKVLEEELAERRAHEAELKAIESQAQSLIQEHLDELTAEFEKPNYETPKAF